MLPGARCPARQLLNADIGMSEDEDDRGWLRSIVRFQASKATLDQEMRCREGRETGRGWLGLQAAGGNLCEHRPIEA